MKKLCVLLMAVLAFAPVSADETKKISISLKDRPVYELFEQLKEKAGFQIVYSREMLEISGKPVTINLDLNNTEAGLILEAASLAAGFTFEKKSSIYIILPVIALYTVPAEGKTSSPVKSDTPDKKETEPESKGSGSVEVVGKKPLPEELTQKRYAGNFMYGQGDKVYLNLVIPTVNTAEEKRITGEMKQALKNGAVSASEAENLFGYGSDISGKDLEKFLKVLYAETLKRLSDDGNLDQKEIHELRNDFINSILNTYEEQQ